MDIPQNMAPGQIIQAAILNIHGEPEVPDNNEHATAMAAMLNASGLEKIDAGDIATLAHAADFFISQISTISSTPVPAGMGGDSQSGEALKQREVRLLGKIRRFHVQGGNNWEDVMRMANQYQRAYGGQGVPEIDAFTVRWVNPELRNDMEIRERAKLVHEWGLTREALRLLSLSSDIDYSEDDIDRLLEEQAEDVNQRLPQAGAPGVPQFGDGEEEAGLGRFGRPAARRGAGINEVIHGDCLDVMRGRDAASVDLVYADPPYCTGRDFGAFDDRWPSREAYLAFMRERLVEAHRLLRPHGSVYLHCDPTASHYIQNHDGQHLWPQKLQERDCLESTDCVRIQNAGQRFRKRARHYPVLQKWAQLLF